MRTLQERSGALAAGPVSTVAVCSPVSPAPVRWLRSYLAWDWSGAGAALSDHAADGRHFDSLSKWAAHRLRPGAFVFVRFAGGGFYRLDSWLGAHVFAGLGK